MARDPFEALREPSAPLAPRPAFAAQLRRRLEAELGLDPTGGEHDMTTPTTPRATTVDERAASSTAGGPPPLVPYLCCRDARAALDFYREVLGAELVGDPIAMPDGRVGHAELRIGASRLYLADEFPEEEHLSPAALGGTPVQLHLSVRDPDATVALALANGAEVLRRVEDREYGARQGSLRDPFGHRWLISSGG
jgi:uncharacterized glyoxalase superfamily protein PhnB